MDGPWIKTVPVVSRIFGISSSTGLGIEGYLTCWKDELGNHTLGMKAQNMCNTRFIKGHKPSNHIRARIKSHVYTIEWIVYHSTYHEKDIIKWIRMLFIILMTKCLIQRKRKNIYEKNSRKQGTTGTSTGRRTPRSPRTPGSSGWTPSPRQELSSSSVTQEEKLEKRQGWVHNLYSTSITQTMRL